MLLILSLEGRKTPFSSSGLSREEVEREECGCLVYVWRHLQVHLLLRARYGCVILLYGCHSLGPMTMAYFRYRLFTHSLYSLLVLHHLGQVFSFYLLKRPNLYSVFVVSQHG